MKQVHPSKYNLQYFEIFSRPDFKNNIFAKKYIEIADLVGPLSSNDLVVDYGCGTGNLCFYLAIKYGCRVIGIDYSTDAIKICNEYLSAYEATHQKTLNVKFIQHNNSNLPKLKNVKVVFFADVFEHMYDSEIKSVLEQINKWGNPLIAVHTDNNFYLKYLQRLINFFNVIFFSLDKNIVKERYAKESELHVNLTTPSNLKSKMKHWGYHQIKLSYPSITESAIKSQLESLQRIPYLIPATHFLVNRMKFLMPSFYALYQKI